MAAPTNHYKLGLFVITGFAVAILAAVFFGGVGRHRHSIRYHSYFNESVQGLDVGAPVKFRGVMIGHVSAIDIAPDHRRVDVVSELDGDHVKRMGLAEVATSNHPERLAVPKDLRAQLNSQGITGVRFVAMDFFDVRSNPPPDLPFTIPTEHYIPAAASLMKNLEDTATKAMDRLPEMVDAVVAIMQRVDGLFRTLEMQDISGKAAASLGHADDLMATIRATFTQIDNRNLVGSAASTLAELNLAATKLNDVLDALAGQKGLLASAQHATDAVGDVGRAGRLTQRELDATLRNVSEAADAIRSFAEAIERDPDMLLKGKNRGFGAK